MASCADIKAFVNPLIGRPYLEGGQGPDGFDCFGLVRLTQKVLFDRAVPIVQVDPRDLRALVAAFKNSELRTVWTERAKGQRAQHGDLVTMTQAKREHHLGTWLDVDGGGVFHALEGVGVCFDAMPHLMMQGWSRFQPYSYQAALA